MHKFVYLKLARPSTERFGSLIKEIFGPVINSNLGVAEGNFTPPPSLFPTNWFSINNSKTVTSCYLPGISQH